MFALIKRRLMLLCCVIGIIGVLPLTSLAVMAQSVSSSWTVGTRLVVSASVPFVWIRTMPASNAPVRATLYPRSNVTVKDAAPRWDGIQWWWLITVPFTNSPVSGVSGWLEQHSLLTGTPPGTLPVDLTPTFMPAPITMLPITWPLGTLITVKSNVPFVWVRNEPSSVSGVNFTVPQAEHVTLKYTESARWDGIQWWIHVNTLGEVTEGGWVEKHSMIPIS